MHPRRVGRLRRALLRFEAGLDRRGAVDALNDHLLALRFLLEGEGPAGVGLPMRVAALTSDEAGSRAEAKHSVEQAIGLERELWSGEPSSNGAGPSEVAAEVEDLLRTILRRAVTGELGTDLRAAADEALLAEGLAFGDGSELGGDTEWEMETVEPAAQTQAEEEPMIEDYDVEEPERIKVIRSEGPWVIEEPLERDQPQVESKPDPQATQAFDPFAGEEEDEFEVVETDVDARPRTRGRP